MAIRDKSYPGEVARLRPALATRIHCDEPRYQAEPAEPGDPTYVEPPHTFERQAARGSMEDDPVAEFNRHLRGGHRAERLRRG